MASSASSMAPAAAPRNGRDSASTTTTPTTTTKMVNNVGPSPSVLAEQERRLLQQIARLKGQIHNRQNPPGSSAPPSAFHATSMDGTMPVTTQPTTRIPCRFFHQFGRCGKGLNCKFSHEAAAVAPAGGRGRGRGRGRGYIGAAAPSFQGTSFQSRAIVPAASQYDARPSGREQEDKAKTLPVCYRFLLGTCLDDHCPYPHVHVNPKADVCADFLAGYCPKGSACKLLHTYECQAWVRTGECNDQFCTFKHPSNVRGLRLKKAKVPRGDSEPSSRLDAKEDGGDSDGGDMKSEDGSSAEDAEDETNDEEEEIVDDENDAEDDLRLNGDDRCSTVPHPELLHSPYRCGRFRTADILIHLRASEHGLDQHDTSGKQQPRPKKRPRLDQPQADDLLEDLLGGPVLPRFC